MAKMKIIDYGFVGDDRTSVRIYTEDGGVIEARRCPTDKPLYCTRDGHFFSLTKFGLREVKPCFAVPRDPRVCHTRYPFMRQFGNKKAANRRGLMKRSEQLKRRTDRRQAAWVSR